jgi:hypothetical protein
VRSVMIMVRIQVFRATIVVIMVVSGLRLGRSVRLALQDADPDLVGAATAGGTHLAHLHAQ